MTEIHTKPQTESVWTAGWYDTARVVASPNHGPRPEGVEVDLVVIHAISLPPGIYGGDAIEKLFTNQLAWEAHPYFDTLRGLEVSAHFLIQRDGRCTQFVSVERRAWHAGRSCWQNRPNCNDYSVGIELEGLDGDTFEPAQYTRLATLIRDLGHRYPIRAAVGHEHIAPGRKADPGPGFDWAGLGTLLSGCPVKIAPHS